jgi:Protein kinase domain
MGCRISKERLKVSAGGAVSGQLGPGGILPALTAGSRVAGYLLEEQVGVGGMAVVYRAWDERLARRAALKVLVPALAADLGFRQRFIRESRAAAAVDDPHIIPVYEAGEAGDLLFIAMRYVHGGDARTLLHREGPLPPARVAAIITAAASALDTAHRAGLVHRDVKPANLLIDVQPGRPDHVYLSDFGLSKGALTAVGLTGTGQFLGTPNYMAPEQIEGREVGGRADQYALACTAYELLTGQAPFQRDDSMAVIWAHMSQPPPPLASRRPGLPPAADVVLARGLAKAPGQRYPSCAAFAAALGTALASAPYPPAPPPPAPFPPTQPPGPGRRPAPFTLALAATALVVFAAAAVVAALLVGSPAHHTAAHHTAGHQTAGHHTAGPAATTTPPARRGQPPRPRARRKIRATDFTVCAVPIVSCALSQMQTKPRTVVLSADGSGLMKVFRWSGWGTAVAIGTGAYERDSCRPDCAQGRYRRSPATITLTGLTPYDGGKRAYADMVVSAPGTAGTTRFRHLVP